MLVALSAEYVAQIVDKRDPSALSMLEDIYRLLDSLNKFNHHMANVFDYAKI